MVQKRSLTFFLLLLQGENKRALLYLFSELFRKIKKSLILGNIEVFFPTL
jgi:hypothetical protein